MYIRTLLASAFFLAISCASLQASVDTGLDVSSDTSGQTVLLMALSNGALGPGDRRSRRADRVDARRGNDQDADPCDAADGCYDACNDDDDGCWDACDDKYPDCADD